MVMAVVLPVAGFLYWTVNFGSDNLRRSVGGYVVGAGTLLYFGVVYLFALMHWLPGWVIAFIMVALLTLGAFLKRESQNRTRETEGSPSSADDSER
jgi:hypothetical protein